MFERVGAHEEALGKRLHIFLLAGMSSYRVLPSPGVRAFWNHLLNLAEGMNLCTVLPESEKEVLEHTIKDEANTWLGESATIERVTLIDEGGGRNGIAFSTETMRYQFTIQYNIRAGATAPWSIAEKFHAVS
jgi:hypothetical protein